MRYHPIPKGFSLVEVIIASLIFSITIAGVFSVFTAQRNATKTAQRKLQAAYLTRRILEDLRAKVDQRNLNIPSVWWLLTCNNPPQPPQPWPQPLSTNLPGAQLNYVCWEIPTGQPGAGSRQLTLTLTWNEL